MPVRHRERHRTERIGWLRAAGLGANDGIVSTASLVLGVAAAHATHSNILVAGVAGLVAGAMSMAAHVATRHLNFGAGRRPAVLELRCFASSGDHGAVGDRGGGLRRCGAVSLPGDEFEITGWLGPVHGGVVDVAYR